MLVNGEEEEDGHEENYGEGGCDKSDPEEAGEGGEGGGGDKGGHGDDGEDRGGDEEREGDGGDGRGGGLKKEEDGGDVDGDEEGGGDDEQQQPTTQQEKRRARKALLEEAKRRRLKVRGKSNVEIERLLRTENNSQKTFKQALEVWRRKAGEKEMKKEEDEVKKKEHNEGVEKVLKERVNVMAPEQIKNCDNDGGTTDSDDDRGKTVSNKNILLFFNSSLNSSTDPFPTRGGQILKHDTKLTSNLI